MTNHAINHAIVYGASGLIGWAIVNQLLSQYPEAGSFSKITAVTNRPLNRSETYWPEGRHRPDLQLVSGVDLRGDVEALKVVSDIKSVTHVFYLAFVAIEDDIEEVGTNRQMLQNVINAHNKLSPGLRFVAFPGGTRGYGIYAPGGTFTPPLHEDMVKTLPADYAQTVVYPAYRELLNAASQGRKWTWCEVCPDAIIGFTPNGSQFSLGLHWAQYLSLYAYNHGIGPYTETNSASTPVEVPFPGNVASANSLFTPVSSTTLAQFMIYASLHPDTCGNGQLFNVADSEVPCTYGALWPRLAEWFGLVGGGPVETSRDQDNALKVGEVAANATSMPGEYIAKHRDIFTRHGRVNAVTGGVGVGNRQLDSVGYWLTFDRQMNLDRLKGTGFDGERDPVLGWLESFSMFRKAGLLL